MANKTTRLKRAFEEQWITSGQAHAIEVALGVLNEALEADSWAMQRLMDKDATVTSQKLINHPSIQVGLDPAHDPRPGHGPGDRYYLRPIGLINGMLGVDADNYGYIAAVYDNKMDLVRFALTEVNDD